MQVMQPDCTGETGQFPWIFRRGSREMSAGINEYWVAGPAFRSPMNRER